MEGRACRELERRRTGAKKLMTRERQRVEDRKPGGKGERGEGGGENRGIQMLGIPLGCLDMRLDLFDLLQSLCVSWRGR